MANISIHDVQHMHDETKRLCPNLDTYVRNITIVAQGREIIISLFSRDPGALVG
jgi:hypothetical protein